MFSKASKLDINRGIFDINDGIISFTKRRSRIPDPNRGARVPCCTYVI